MWVFFRGYNVNLVLFMQLTSVIILCLIQTSTKPFQISRLNHIDSFCLAMLIIQLLSAIVFSSRYYWLSYIMASYNYVVAILFFGIIVCQCWEKCKCKFRKERSHDCCCVVFPSNEEYDKMRQALLILSDYLKQYTKLLIVALVNCNIVYLLISNIENICIGYYS